MKGFVQLDAMDGQGSAWVRLAHVTAIRTIHYREGSGEPDRHLVSVLAGGEWWRDRTEHPTAEGAAARVEELAGSRPASSLRGRVAEVLRRVDPV